MMFRIFRLDILSQNIQFAKTNPLILEAFQGFHTPPTLDKKMDDAKDDRKHPTRREVEKLIANHQGTILLTQPSYWQGFTRNTVNLRKTPSFRQI